jgi:hypothetical protein
MNTKRSNYGKSRNSKAYFKEIEIMENSNTIRSGMELPKNVLDTKPTNTYALVSLIAGVLGVFMFGSLVAVVCGHIARRKIIESDGYEKGDNYALIGLTLGYLMLAASIIIIIFMLVVDVGITSLVNY